MQASCLTAHTRTNQGCAFTIAPGSHLAAVQTQNNAALTNCLLHIQPLHPDCPPTVTDDATRPRHHATINLQEEAVAVTDAKRFITDSDALSTALIKACLVTPAQWGDACPTDWSRSHCCHTACVLMGNTYLLARGAMGMCMAGLHTHRAKGEFSLHICKSALVALVACA